MHRLPYIFFLYILLTACGPAPAATSAPATDTAFPTMQATLAQETATLKVAPTITPTPLATLEPTQVWETIQPLIKEPNNCDVPCFLGIIPGKTSLDEARIFFSRLGLISREGTDPNSGKYFYSIAYDPTTGDNSYITLLINNNNLVENIVVNPDIPTPKKGSPREWVAYSPETLIKRYGSPSSVRFYGRSYGLAGSPPNIAIDMIMYFDTSDLIVHYSGGGMTPQRFCPLTAPFDFVRLWIGPYPPNAPSFGTMPLEEATSLTMDQFAQLMTGDPKKACFKLKVDLFGP